MLLAWVGQSIIRGLLAQSLDRILHCSIVLLPRRYANVSQSDSEGTEVKDTHIVCRRVCLRALWCGLLALTLLIPNTISLRINVEQCFYCLCPPLVPLVRLVRLIGLVVALGALSRR